MNLHARQLFDERTLSGPSYIRDREINVLKATKDECVSDGTGRTVVGRDSYPSSLLRLPHDGSG